jgi:hypothetical protein
MEKVEDSRDFQISKAISMDMRPRPAGWTLQGLIGGGTKVKPGELRGLSFGQTSPVAWHRLPPSTIPNRVSCTWGKRFSGRRDRSCRQVKKRLGAYHAVALIGTKIPRPSNCATIVQNCGAVMALFNSQRHKLKQPYRCSLFGTTELTYSALCAQDTYQRCLRSNRAGGDVACGEKTNLDQRASSLMAEDKRT